MAGVGFSSTTTIALVFLVLCNVGPSMAVLFTSLNKTLVVSASVKAGDVLHAGKDKFTVTWALNETLPTSVADNYKTVKVLLCYAPISQKDRKWRKTNVDLKKDKTCQFKIVKKPYAGNGTVEYEVKRDVPSALYFIRAYALDASDTQVAFGQTTDKNKTVNIFEVVGISGRTLGIDISAGVFSAFSIVALVYFYIVENKKRK